MEAIQEVAERLRRAERVLFVTGAGISADSGLPTYRGSGGLYDCDPTDDGLPIEVALSGSMMASRPEICWKHIAQIEGRCRDAKPNAAHRVIADLDSRLQLCLVLTQNVDGFHAIAGSRDIIEIHGNLRRLRCDHCHYAGYVQDYADLRMPPQCRNCGRILRPDVVLFGELLSEHALARLEREQAMGFDLVFSIGTSSLFPYIVEPIVRARAERIPTVEINPAVTPISALVDFHIRLGAASAMSAIAAHLEPSGK